MAITLLVDESIDGHVFALIRHAGSSFWSDFRDYLQLSILRLREVGLPHSVNDRVIWEFLSRHPYILITDNRNSDGKDSLGVILEQNQDLDRYPVLTIGDIDRFANQDEYTFDVIESLYDYLLRIETLRGTGRLFLPQ